MPPHTGDNSSPAVKTAQQTATDKLTSGVAMIVHACELATSMALARVPVPAVHILRFSGTPQDRMAFARLSPSHTETKENLLSMFPHLVFLSDTDLDDAIAYSPPTDQISFFRYIRETVPKYLIYQSTTATAKSTSSGSAVLAASGPLQAPLLPPTQQAMASRSSPYVDVTASSMASKEVSAFPSTP